MPVNEGMYRGEPTLVRAGKSDTEKQSEYIAIVFEIDEMMDGGEWVFAEGFTREIRLFITDAARPYTLDKLEALGLDMDELGRLLEAAAVKTGDMAIPADALKWAPWVTEEGVRLSCKHSQDGEKTRENWQLELTRVHQPSQCSADILRLLRAEWKTRQSAAKKPPAPAMPRSAKTPAQADTKSAVRDDELPGTTPTGDAQEPEDPNDVKDDDIPF